MRRWLTATALGGLLAVALAGCGERAGVDGDLTDEWGGFAAPAPFVPAAGTCHREFEDPGLASVYHPVDCARAHLVETVHVGTFTGEHAARTTSPPAGSAAARAAYAECDRRATGYVGAEWRSARLELAVVVAPERAWSGGARWFRCDLAEIDNLDDAEWVTRTGSLAGALAGRSPLSHGCFNPKLAKDVLDRMRTVACDRPHHSEYVGVYRAPHTTYAAFTNDSERVHRGCRDVLAGYAKLPKDGDLDYRAGTIFYGSDEDDWNAGDRGVRCFLWLRERTLTRSVKGGGARALPVS